MTEDEARKRECRFVPPIALPMQGVGGIEVQVKILNCSASMCMAWQQRTTFDPETKTLVAGGYCGRVETQPKETEQ